jgi:putative ABC transport system permease protein
MTDWLREIRHSARALGSSPGFAAVSVLSLALAIAVNTAVLGVGRAVLVAPLAVAAPDELRLVCWSPDKGTPGVNQINSSSQRDPRTGRDFGSNYSSPVFEAMRDAARARGTDAFAFTFLRQASVAIEDQPVVAGGMLVSGNYFAAMGVPMALGRGLDDADDRDGAAPAVVLSHALWRRGYGGDRAALGRTIRINGQPFTVVGITAPRYFGVSNGGFFPPADVTAALHAQPMVAPRWTPSGGSLFTAERPLWLHVMTRVPRGQNDAPLHDALAAAFARHPATAATGIASAQLALLPGARGLDSLRRTFETPIRVLSGVAALVFVIACVNVAGLALARGLARRREFWIRLALGAGRGRLVREAVTESLCLAAAGGACGIALSLWGAPVLVAMLAGTRAHAIRIEPDLPLLLTGAAIASLAALLFGIVPALRLARVAAAPEFLREGGTAAGAPRLRAGRVLIAIQIAVSVPLVVGSALFLKTIHNLASVDLGFDPANLIVFKLDPSLNNYDVERSRRLLADVLARLQAEPGVRGATLIENGLIAGSSSNTRMRAEGGEPKQILFNRVGAGFFETIGLPLIAGRGIGLQDRQGSARVGVVNETAVRQFFGGQNPIGRQISMGAFFRSDPIEIVGVARDSKYATLKGPPRPIIFLPYAQTGDTSAMVVAVRSDGTRGLPGRIRTAVAEIDRDVPVTDLKTEEAQIDESIGSERMFTTLLVFFGGFALMLACIGLHGVTTYAVARRTSEIGVRMALGAQRGQVLWLVLRQVVMLAVIGLAIGIPVAAAASRSVRALLFGVEPADPWSLAAGALAMLAVALGSGYLPARRAAQLDPLVALRRE